MSSQARGRQWWRGGTVSRATCMHGQGAVVERSERWAAPCEGQAWGEARVKQVVEVAG